MRSISNIFLTAAILVFAGSAHARTNNPVELTISGGYTYYSGVSETTQLFLDRENGTTTDFWVRVIDDPGTPPVIGIEIDIDNDVVIGPPQLPTTVYIKHFPISRYVEVRKAFKKIQTFGVVNPYVDGYVICDAPNSTIRIRKQTINMAYNCGASAPAADQATFDTEALLKALRAETRANPDLQGTLP